MEIHRRNIVFNRGTTLPQRFSIFLNTNNATNIINGHLTLEKKLFFIRDDGPIGRELVGRTEVESVEFSEQEFENFKIEFKRINEAYWSNKFWIIPPDSYDAFDVIVNVGGVNKIYRPNVKFDLRILYANSESEADGTFVVHNAWRIAGGQRHQLLSHSSTMLPVRDGQEDLSQAERHRGHLYTYANEPTPGSVWGQTASIHEFGHTIGEDHVGIHLGTPGCHFGDNDDTDICYQSPTGDTGNIMGGGTMVEDWNAEPWMFGLDVVLGSQISRWRLDVNRLGSTGYRFPTPRLIGDAPFYQQENLGLF